MNLTVVLIADGDVSHRERLRDICRERPELDAAAAVGDPFRAVQALTQFKPQIAIVDANLRWNESASLIEHIALVAPDCQIIGLSSTHDPDIMRHAMRAGAREFLVRPVTADSLMAAVQHVYSLGARKHSATTADDGTAARTRQGQVIAVWGPKGGVGRTFLAVNLAVAFAAARRERVLLVDGCLGLTTMDIALDVKATQSLADMIGENGEDLGPAWLKAAVIHHNSGADLLLGAIAQGREQISAAVLQRVVAVARRAYELIIIDTPDILQDTTLALLDAADTILTVCNPDIGSLRNLGAFLEAAGRLGYRQSKLQLVINRSDMRGAISQAEIEKISRMKVIYVISNDHEAVTTSINRGRPLVLSHPQRPVSRQIASLAAALTQRQ